MPVLSGDQIAMVDALRGISATGEGHRRTRDQAAAYPTLDRKVWSRLCADGWPLLLVPVEKGGSGASAIDLVALCDGTGDQLAPEPLFAAAVAIALLASFETPATAALLARIAAGEAIPLLARRATFAFDDVPTHVLSDAVWASHVIWGDEKQPSRLFVSPAESIAKESVRRTTDGGSLSFFIPDAASVCDKAQGPALIQAYRNAEDLLRLASAATLVAVARAALETTLAYLRTREQFGVPLGSFQVIQHALATCHVSNGAARALCFEAARGFGSPKQTAASLMAKAEASTVAMRTVKACVQYHGAMGFCDETDIALFFRRAQTLHAAYGAPDSCL